MNSKVNPLYRHWESSMSFYYDIFGYLKIDKGHTLV